MSGCLTLPLRLALVALLVVGGFVAWSYRREIRHQVHEWTADPASEAASRGAPVPDGAASARGKVASLEAPGRDSVVLSPSEVASLVADVISRRTPNTLDSVTVRLGHGELEVTGVVDTRKVPVTLGPLRGMLRPAERVEAGGQLLFRRTGRAEWAVDRLRVRGVPLPRELFARVLDRFGDSPGTGTIVLPLPGTITGLRVTPAGVTLYGSGGPR